MAVLGALGPDEISAIVFIDIAVIVAVARIVGALFRRIGQPAVVGEILAGIMLGPSLLGLLPGDLPDTLFPLEVRPFLNVVAQLGLIIFMFIVGLELDTTLVRGKERIAAVISLSSIVLPFGLGIVLAAGLHSSHLGPPGAEDFLPFGLFIGASMAITAFPVLARILSERDMTKTEIGALALACSAVDDILAWSMLAVVIAIVASSSALDLPRILLMSAGYIGFMFLVIKPRLELLASRYRREGRLTPGILAIVLIGFLTSAWVTSIIGIHSIFGAFLFGVVMPRKDTTRMFHEILERLEQVSVLLLLPVFFIVTGLEVDITGLGRSALTELPLILLVAVAGKFLGASAGARIQGIGPRKSAAVGVLMNTRGLTELVILTIGRDLGVLDTTLFTMLVVMAVLTTIMTAPLLRLVYPNKLLERDIAEAEKAAMGVVDAYRVIVVVGESDDADHLVDTACDVIGDQDPAELVLARFQRVGDTLEVGAGLVSELAETATVLEELKGLARRAEARGVRATVRLRSTNRAADELVRMAEAVDANLVLASWEDEDLAQRLLDRVRAPVGILRPGRGDISTGPDWPVLVVGGDEGNDAAAMELALRVARSNAVGVLVGTTDAGRKTARKTSAWVQRASRGGIDCRILDDGGSGVAPEVAPVSLGVRGAYHADDSRLSDSVPVLVVRASADDDGRDLERLLDRLPGGEQTPETTEGGRA